MTDAVSKGHLKRLEFVRSYSGAALSKAGDVGTTLKQYLPASVKPHVEKAMDQAKSSASPMVAKTQDWGEQFLTVVDSKVRGCRHAAGFWCEQQAAPGPAAVPDWGPGHQPKGLPHERANAETGRCPRAQVDGMIVTGHRIYSSGAEELKSQVERQKQFHEKNMEHYSKAREAYLKKIEETVDFLKKEGLSGTAKVAADKVMARVEDAKKLPGYVSSNAKVSLCDVLCCSAVLFCGRPAA